MNALKIGIVEDNLLIAESIVLTLRQIGYSTTEPAQTYLQALAMIKDESPDLLLIDIMIDGDKDGIELAVTVNKEMDIPFIFLTGNSDEATVNRAKLVKPAAYLLKPFSREDLFTSIEIALGNYKNERKSIDADGSNLGYLQDVLFIKEGDLYHKIEINDILYIESDNVYLSIYTTTKHFVTRGKLDDFVQRLNKSEFFKVHRSYVVNLKHLETLNLDTVKVGGKDVPIHKNYKQDLLKNVSLIK